MAGRNTDYLKIQTEFTGEVIKAGVIINMFPNFLKPYVAVFPLPFLFEGRLFALLAIILNLHLTSIIPDMHTNSIRFTLCCTGMSTGWPDVYSPMCPPTSTAL